MSQIQVRRLGQQTGQQKPKSVGCKKALLAANGHVYTVIAERVRTFLPQDIAKKSDGSVAFPDVTPKSLARSIAHSFNSIPLICVYSITDPQLLQRLLFHDSILIIFIKYVNLIHIKDWDEYLSYTYAIVGAYVSTSRLKAHYEYP